MIDAKTGRVTGIIGDRIAKGDSIGETIFKIAEDYQEHHNMEISGILLRYNNSNERKNLEYIPFAIVEND